MSPHADVTVQIYSEVSDRSRRNNDVDADTQTGLWNLMLTSNGCTPEHFRLGCVELKTIRLHPFCNVIHASRNPLLQLQDFRRRRVAADSIYTPSFMKSFLKVSSSKIYTYPLRSLCHVCLLGICSSGQTVKPTPNKCVQWN